MKRREFEQYLQLTIPDLFSFVWALTGNTSQSEKIIWSTLEALHLEEKDLIDRLSIEDRESGLLDLYKLHVYKHSLYLISKIQDTYSNSSDAFESLDLEEKAVLYLRHRTPMSMEEISDIMDCEKSEVSSTLYSAREKLKELSFVYEQKVS